MGETKRLRRIALFSLLAIFLLVLAACESADAKKKRPASAPVVVPPSPFLSELPPPPLDLSSRPDPPKFDPTGRVLEDAEELYRQGEEDYRQGHLDRAKKAFDRAMDIYLKSPVPIRSDERLENGFESLVDRIYSHELLALKEGDAFTAQKYEPAPSDEILSIETFPSRIDDKLKVAAEREITEIPHDLPITVNDRVLNFLEYFTHGRGRKAMEVGLRRAGMYRPMITRILQETGVPKDLIFLAQVESGFQPLALSNKKAKGIWQFVPFRGAEYGLAQNWWVDERQDPEKSTRAAARHLMDLYNQFDDWLLAMAAYNCGPGNVQRAIERTGYANFWQMVDRNVLPLQTMNYIPAILAVTIIGKDPRKYGFEVDPVPPLETERVPVSTPTDLRLIAETIDTPVETLQELNPQLLRMSTPPNVPDFQLSLPAGTGETFLKEIAAIPEDKRVLWRRHRVGEGETLSTIAQKYKTTVTAISQVNGMIARDILTEGTKIIIPAAPTSRKIVAIKHRVERGETPASIAEKYDVTISELRQWNRLGSRTQLARGQRLTIRMAASQPTRAGQVSMAGKKRSRSTASNKKPASSHKRSVVHSVRKGETLSMIAANYNTTVESLKLLNGIANARQLRAGEKIRIAVGQ